MKETWNRGELSLVCICRGLAPRMSGLAPRMSGRSLEVNEWRRKYVDWGLEHIVIESEMRAWRGNLVVCHTSRLGSMKLGDFCAKHEKMAISKK